MYIVVEAIPIEHMLNAMFRGAVRASSVALESSIQGVSVEMSFWWWAESLL
jgi:hypothetical protein